MKIAYVIINANRHEGTSRAILEVAERLAVSHQVDLLSRTFEPRESRFDVQDEQIQHASGFWSETGNLSWIRIPGPKRPEVVDFESFRLLCNHKLRRADYDIIHSAGPNTDLADVYTVQTVHPEKVRQFADLRLTFKAGWFRKFAWRRYDHRVMAAEREAYRAIGFRGPRFFLPVSQGTKAEFMQHFPAALDGDTPSNVAVLPNAADLKRFHPANRDSCRQAIRDEQGLDFDDFVLVFSGGDWVRKGLDIAIRSLALIDSPRVKLLVVGHDRAGAEVQLLCGQLGLQDRVRFAGFRKDVYRYYAAGDLFVFPSAYEAFSLATIEAAASGLPVLMSDVSGAHEIVGSGECGILIRRDPAHIAESVMRYLRNPEMLRAQGLAGRALVEREFNWDTIANQTLGVYQNLLARRHEFGAVNP
ncbi:MAG TPA: glycosyltransferase family 1 protein [Planctomycetaceae bacterium]|nr:glycosyltransferase family 1 protein [Planctomycetaceae bacterium]